MRLFFTVSLIFLSLSLFSQDELLKELEESEPEIKQPVLATFSGTRLVNGHSIETLHHNTLEFIITHRFGTLNSGSYELWGLDFSVIRLGLEYGITDRLGVGIGRSSSDKTFDSYVKYKLLQQREGMPVTVTALGTAAFKSSLRELSPEPSAQDKMSYVAQLLIARKFSSRVSIQLAPAFLHMNTVEQSTAVNDLLSLGIGGRFKITKSMALLVEYNLRLNEKSESPYKDALGVCVEFETGGHVFQIVLTNSLGMVERQFMAETDGDFFDGDIHLGFNITRAFQFGRKK